MGHGNNSNSGLIAQQSYDSFVKRFHQSRMVCHDQGMRKRARFAWDGAGAG